LASSSSPSADILYEFFSERSGEGGRGGGGRHALAKSFPAAAEKRLPRKSKWRKRFRHNRAAGGNPSNCAAAASSKWLRFRSKLVKAPGFCNSAPRINAAWSAATPHCPNATRRSTPDSPSSVHKLATLCGGKARPQRSSTWVVALTFSHVS
jgi:hypothetical protein